MLVVKDDKGAIFGAFLSDPLRPQLGHFGTGECFLWRLTGNSTEKQPRRPSVKLGNDQLQVYLATNENPYFIIAESEFLAIGCGDGKFGLLLDGDLLNGQSNHVPTFRNDILASDRDFVCVGVEVWRFDVASQSSR